jgi:peptide/nickel transport system ATP-binding protein
VSLIPPNAILKVINLRKWFPVKKFFFTVGYVKAVDGVTLGVEKGKTLGIVGESGCGKTTLARLILRLIEPDEGEILFHNKNILNATKEELMMYRRKVSIVFQDPYGSLNPKMTIRDILREPLITHKIDPDMDIDDYIALMLEKVGLQRQHMYRYPHEFSGGQRQRIAIARALMSNPEIIVLDEPTSALDVSVQAQILNMLKKLQREKKLTYIFITHDLGVVRYMSDYIAVMYLGKIVEYGKAEEVFENPLHPYTRILFSSIPIPDPKIARSRSKIIPKGEPPSPINPPQGCRFHPRCPYMREKCKEIEPELIEITRDHYVACHYPLSNTN